MKNFNINIQNAFVLSSFKFAFFALFLGATALYAEDDRMKNQTGNVSIHSNTKITLKSDIGDSIDINSSIIKDLDLSAELRYSETEKAVFDGAFDIVIKSGNKEAHFVTKQERYQNPSDSNKMSVKYVGKKNEAQDYEISCFMKQLDNAVANDNSSPQEKEIDCIKRSACQSFALNTSKEFEIKEVPICIGKKTVKMKTKNVKTGLSCVISASLSDGDASGTVIIESLKNKTIEEIETTSSACK